MDVNMLVVAWCIDSGGGDDGRKKVNGNAQRKKK